MVLAPYENPVGVMGRSGHVIVGSALGALHGRTGVVQVEEAHLALVQVGVATTQEIPCVLLRELDPGGQHLRRLLVCGQRFREESALEGFMCRSLAIDGKQVLQLIFVASEEVLQSASENMQGSGADLTPIELGWGLGLVEEDDPVAPCERFHGRQLLADDGAFPQFLSALLGVHLRDVNAHGRQDSIQARQAKFAHIGPIGASIGAIHL